MTYCLWEHPRSVHPFVYSSLDDLLFVGASEVVDGDDEDALGIEISLDEDVDVADALHADRVMSLRRHFRFRQDLFACFVWFLLIE